MNNYVTSALTRILHYAAHHLCKTLYIKQLVGVILRNNIAKPVICLFILLFGVVQAASADDHFVITHTMKSQDEAQEKAALMGGWVLNTNLYGNLKPNLFAVVRGPFKSIKKAKRTLDWLKKGGNYPGSYVKSAGKVNISVRLGNKYLSPQMLTALFGEFTINISKEKGAENPCKPQEPYYDISITHVGLARKYNSKTEKSYIEPVRQNIDMGGFWQIISTGEISRMRICAE